MEPEKCPCVPFSNPKASSASLPSGPSGLPAIGSILEYKGPKTNLEWTEQYGPIYYVRMGDKKLVYLNTIELVEKYMEGPNGEQFLGRPVGPAAFGEGLLFGSGDKWRSNKRAFMKALHTSTLVEDMESAVQNEVAIALEDLNKQAPNDHPIKIGDTLLPACANVISGFLLGESLPMECPDRDILHAIVKNLEGVDLNSPLVQMSLKHPKLFSNLKKFMYQDMVDIYGTSRRLQRLIGQWIHQTRNGLQAAIYHNTHHHEESPAGLNKSCKVEEKRHLLDQHQPYPTVKISPPKTDNFETGYEESTLSVTKTRSLEAMSSHCMRVSENDGNYRRPRNILQKQQEVEYIPVENKNFLSAASDLNRKFISTESLLTVQDDSEEAAQTVEKQVHFAALGFMPGDTEKQLMEPVVLPVLPTETSHGTETTEEVFQRHLGREMSLNENHNSILHRILAQPEFSAVDDGIDKEMLQSLVDMFFGGVTTVLSGLEFVLMYLSKNPQLQMLAQQEIDNVLCEEAKRWQSTSAHSDVKITWSMRDKMPFLRACVAEGLRLGCVTPSSLPHVATDDGEIEGFLIPKGTFVLASIYSMHRDPTEYDRANEFKPQRHLDSNIKFKLPRSFRPYGIGARRCIGERLAEMELFIFTAAILKEFDVISPPGSKKASEMKTHMRIVHRLKNFKCILQKRK